MRLRRELLQTVTSAYVARSPGRVRQVVKPPRCETGGSSFTTVALTDGGVGVSYNLFHRNPQRLQAFHAWDTACLSGRDALEISQLVLSEDLFERTVGLAVLNALSQELFREDPAAYGIDFNSSLEDLIAPAPDDTVGMVGYFTPTIKELLGRVGDLVVLERDPGLLAGTHPFTVTDDPAQLERCSKVLMSATTVINDSLPELMPHTQAARLRVVMGPSAGFVPGPLFALGIDIVGGIFITDPELFVTRFAKGIKWGDAAHKIWHLRGTRD